MGSNRETLTSIPQRKNQICKYENEGTLLLPLLQLIKLSLLEITWVLFPLQPYSIGQTEKYIATDETHHLGTHSASSCLQRPCPKLCSYPFEKRKVFDVIIHDKLADL